MIGTLRSIAAISRKKANASGLTTISAHPTLTTSMVSYYEFDEASDNLIDRHGSNDGTVTGPTYGVTGVINDAYSFATNDYVNTGYTPTANSDVSYACWVKYDGTLSVYAAVMSNHNSGGSYGYHINISGSPEKFNWVVTGVSSAIATDAIVDNQWYFVVGTYNATTNDAKLYVDGVLVATQNGTANANTGGTLHFGRAGAYNGRYLNGDIDLAGVWSKELTAGEVADLYNGGSGMAYDNSSVFTVTTGQNTAGAVGYSTTADSKHAQSFVPDADWTVSEFYGIFYKAGTIADDIEIRIETDSSGAPSGTLVDANATVTIDPNNFNTPPGKTETGTFPGTFTLSSGTTYWIVLQRTGSYSTVNYGAIRFNSTSNDYASGTRSWYNENTTTWTNANYDLTVRLRYTT